MTKFFKKSHHPAPKVSNEKNPLLDKLVADILEAARRSESLTAKRFLSRLKGLHTSSSVFLRSPKSHEEKNAGTIENRLK